VSAEIRARSRAVRTLAFSSSSLVITLMERGTSLTGRSNPSTSERSVAFGKTLCSWSDPLDYDPAQRVAALGSS